MTEREQRFLLEIYELRARLRRTQGKLRNVRARLRLWPERQRAWRRERRALEDELVRVRRILDPYVDVRRRPAFHTPPGAQERRSPIT